MEEEWSKYREIISAATASEQQELYQNAIALAKSSWPHIDGMMQFERKRLGHEWVRVEGIELVLKYAPLFFDFESLDAIETLLKAERRIAKNSVGNLSNGVAAARLLMFDAYRVWNYLERLPAGSADDSGNSHFFAADVAASVIQFWEKLDVVRRATSERLTRFGLSTRMDEQVCAKCPSCGVLAKTTKAKFLRERDCPKCQHTVVFVLLTRAIDTHE
jgi:hypothetical protein